MLNLTVKLVMCISLYNAATQQLEESPPNRVVAQLFPQLNTLTLTTPPQEKKLLEKAEQMREGRQVTTVEYRGMI